MTLTVDEQITKEAVFRIYANAKFGMIAHFIVMVLTAYMLSLYLDSDLILLGVLIHILVLLLRTYLLVKFNKYKDTHLEYNEIKTYLSFYRISMFLSALSFSMILFFTDSLPIEYNFVVLCILIGLASGSIFTIGEVSSIYFLYLFGTLGFALVWLFLHDGEIYKISFAMMIVTIYYFGLTSKRYAHNLKEVIEKENRLRKYLFEQLEAQDEIIEQKGILAYQSQHDMLTDLPNKVLFNMKLTEGIKEAERNSTVLALFFIDLDNFKVINDSLGHEIGDKVLQDVTLRLTDIIRSHDTLARWGGDEFTIIICDLNNDQGATRLAEEIIHVLKEPFEIDNHTLYITSSIGISTYPKDSTQGDDLVKYADSAMYKAKDEGKNNFQFYADEMTEMALERVVMESSIRAAIENEEFIVHYQPQIDAKNNKLIGMEALVRWEHPKIGLVQPYKFIPLAEETGLIVQIDKLVMAMAMEQFSKWYAQGYNPGVLSLNLAIKHLEENRYIDKLQSTMRKFSFESKYLELELTESDVMKKPEQAIDKLNQISSLGIKVSIDDFGTGYSSLSYLKKLPISKLKIDKSFVDEIPHDNDGKAIVEAVVAMAHSLRLDLIAEGVESEKQVEFLLKQGCHNIQGYYYSKPITVDEMTEFMKNHN